MADPTPRDYVCKWFGCIRDAHATIRGDHEALEKLFAAAIESAKRAAAERARAEEREECAKLMDCRARCNSVGMLGWLIVLLCLGAACEMLDRVEVRLGRIEKHLGTAP